MVVSIVALEWFSLGFQGAALAAVATYQLIQRHPQVKKRLFLIQFGAPRYARKSLARWLNKELDGRIMQCVFAILFETKPSH